MTLAELYQQYTIWFYVAIALIAVILLTKGKEQWKQWQQKKAKPLPVPRPPTYAPTPNYNPFDQAPLYQEPTQQRTPMPQTQDDYVKYLYWNQEQLTKQKIELQQRLAELNSRLAYLQQEINRSSTKQPYTPQSPISKEFIPTTEIERPETLF